MDSLVYIIVGVVVGAGGVGAFMLLQRQWQRQTLASAEEIAKLIIEEAKKEGTVLKKEAEVQAKDVILQARTESEREARDRKRDVQQLERRLQSREEALEKKAETLEGREGEFTRREQGLKKGKKRFTSKKNATSI